MPTIDKGTYIVIPIKDFTQVKNILFVCGKSSNGIIMGKKIKYIALKKYE